jgi:hypothetical protein
MSITLTMSGTQFEAMHNELKKHFDEIWQNVDTPNELEAFIGRLEACGMSDEAEEYNRLWLESYNEWLREFNEINEQ